jgi:hypothetical protein
MNPSRNDISSTKTTMPSPWLRKMRGYFFFRPLIVILAFLMLPPEFGNFNIFVPKAQAFPNNVPQNCLQTGGTWVIQLVCQGPSTNGAPPQSLVTAVEAFETETLQQYLISNNLPFTTSDLAFFYQYARTDLRVAFRAFMELRMINIAFKDPLDRTATEVAALSWFTERLWQHEKDMYQSAVNDRNSYQSNRCGWPIDQDVAKAYGINYVACVGTQEFNNAPTKDYFLAAAKKRIYDNILAGPTGSWTAGPAGITSHAVRPSTGLKPASSATSSPNAPQAPPVYSVFVLTNTELGAIIGSVAGCAGLIGISIGVAQIPSVANVITPFVKRQNQVDKIKNKFDLKNKLSETKQTNKASDEDLQDEVTENTQKAANQASTEGDTAAENDVESVALEEGEGIEFETTAELGSELELEAASEAGLLAAGPIGIILGIAALLITVVITLVATEAEAEASLGALDTLNNTAQTTPPDVLAFAEDDTGKYKLQVLWAEATYPDIYSTAPLPSPGPNDYTLYQLQQGQTTATPATGLVIPDWSYNNWTPTLYGGWFIRSGTRQIPTTIPVTGSRTIFYDSISPYIRYWGWDGYQYEARRIGLNFAITPRQTDDTQHPCPADARIGVTPPQDFSVCSSYVASSLQVTDVNAATPYTIFPAAPPQFPFFSNLQELSTLTNLLTIPVFATGLPTPTISVDPSTPLPPGFTFQPGVNPITDGIVNFRFQGASAQAGSFTVKLNATNVAGTTSATYIFNVSGPDLNVRIDFLNPLPNSQVTWISGVPIQPLHWRVSVGSAANFTLVGPNSTLPPGITLNDNGDGTATMSGTPRAASPPTGTGNVTACYGTTTGVCTGEPFSYVITPPPASQLDGYSWKFPTGLTTTYNLTTHPLAITPITISASCLDLPYWAALTDNGDGTAVLTGTPPNGAGGAVPIHIQVVTQGLTPQDPFTYCNTSSGQTLVSDATPKITSANTATVTVGQPSFVQLSANISSAEFFQNSALPLGLVFSSPGNGLLSGTPLPGSGGSYAFNYFVLNPLLIQFGVPPLFGTLTMTVLEAPSLTLPTTIYFMPGVTNNFAVAPGGYPTLGGMSVALTGSLPSGVFYNDVVPTNSQKGFGSMHGTPLAAASGNYYPLSFQATNSQGTATATTLLHILKTGDVTHDDVVDCKDYDLVKAALNSKAGGLNYNPLADVNSDGVVNVVDLAFITAHLPAGTKCQ